MKVFFLLLMFITSSVYADKPATNVMIEHWQTKNGAQIYFVHSPVIPMIDIQVVFAAGSAYDGKQWGIASLVNSMLGEGSVAHNADQISDSFDSVGAQFSQGIDQDIAQLKLRSLTMPKYLNPALATFVELLNKPNFPVDALQRVKQQTLAGIQLGEQTPSVIASEAFLHEVYHDHPYAHPTEGTVNNVQSFTQADVKAFYQRFYVAKNADVIMVGNISRQQAENIAEQIVGNLPSGESAPRLSMAQNNEQAQYQFISFPAKQDTIVIGQVGIDLRDPKRFALMVGNEILGGEPLSSILFSEVRNKRGLVYQVSSQFSPLRYRGPFYIELQSRADQAKSAMQVAKQALANFIQQGPTAAQLTEAQRNMIGSFPLRISSNASILDSVTAIAFYGMPLDYLNTYTQNVQSVTADQVKSAFQQTVHSNKMKIIVVGASDPASHQQLSQKNTDE
jgi:zinc protease